MIEPICACCRRPFSGPWAVTQPRVYVICGDGSCEGWARSQGLTFYATGSTEARHVAGPRRPARRKPAPKPPCYCCGGELPGRKRERFTVNGKQFCTLTCAEGRTIVAQPFPGFRKSG